MEQYTDLETGEEYKGIHPTISEGPESEHSALLPSEKHEDFEDVHALQPQPQRQHLSRLCGPRIYLVLAFVAGIASCLLVQLIICASRGDKNSANSGVHPDQEVEVYAPPYAGSSEIHNFPPASPTNVFPSLFPTNVGHAGPTPTGAEPALIATAPSYPVHTGAPHLVSPHKAGNKTVSSHFDLFQHWGNLSPWFSFSYLVNEPASYGGPANFSARLNQAAAGWNASGDLEFMNTWFVLIYT
ncbi:hypothetical protein PHLCEN_2v1796 [Hermanssonia centrifuga]|uniref:Uncharacterized protein n=1 Tax=Hermanssonia centrifuga TaxID=98765 RepID=A0A2R6RVY8_9APHY|nr:hypothetical protein PHLCEN_2v1796 [Hermanssonia centrifuga]